MGNEHGGNEPSLRRIQVGQPPMLSQLPKQGLGFNSYDVDTFSPQQSPNHKTTNSHFEQIVTQVTLTQPQTLAKELSSIGEEGASVEEDNKELDYSITTTEPKINKQLSFVPTDNIVSNINSLYTYKKQLGSGASCRVLKACHIENGKLYAIKELTRKVEINAVLFSEEVKLLKKLVHPNILRYYNCYMDEQCYYIATDFCRGGTMLDKIIKMKSFSEKKASKYIHTILSAVNYMHAINIVHRDLKAQNMVFDKDGIDGVLQIIDFGDSKLIKEEKMYSEFVGTIHYLAPEVVRKRSGKELKKSDMWSIGVITYLLVCGSPPFQGHSQKEILSHIVNKKKPISYPKGIRLSKYCKQFIESLLCHDIKKRLGAREALKHAWIGGDKASTHNLSVDVLESLQRYRYNNKLQDILVNAILCEMDVEDQTILSQGLLTMNRDQSTMDNDSVVNYLLLHASINKDYSAQESWKQKRISEIRLFHHVSQKSLTKVSNENKASAVFVPSKVLNGPVSVPSKVGAKHEKKDTMTDLLEELGIDTILEQVDQKEKELETTEDMSRARNVSDEDMSLRRITTNRFRAIMGKADKKYDVEHIVNELDDGTGYIPLNKISSYSKRVRTMKNVFATPEINKSDTL